LAPTETAATTSTWGRFDESVSAEKSQNWKFDCEQKSCLKSDGKLRPKLFHKIDSWGQFY
jgi:hypothetical protein